MEVLVRPNSSFVPSALLVFIVALGIICVCNESEGAESSFKAAISVKEEYDDNVFLTKDNKESDYITRAIPAIDVTYKTPWWDFRLDNEFYWWYFAKRGNSYTSDYLDMSSKLGAAQNLLHFDVTDVFSNVILETRGPIAEANFNVNTTDQNIAKASPYLKYDLNPTSTVKTGYEFKYIWYESTGINRQQHKGFLTIEHKFSPTLNASLGGEYLADMPGGDSPHDNQWAVSTSMSYKVNAKTSIDGTAGYRWIEFSNSNDYARPIYNIVFGYGQPDLGKVEVRASSEFVIPPLSGIAHNTLQEISFLRGDMPADSISSVSGYRAGIHRWFTREPAPLSTRASSVPKGIFLIKASVYHSKDKYIEIVRTDEAFGLSAGLAYRLNPRTTCNLSGAYEKDKYSPGDEKRTVYAASASVDYKIAPKFTVGLTYRYNKSNGDLNGNNYVDNLAGVQVRMEL
jgi:opacity protein-like surface antigen